MFGLKHCVNKTLLFMFAEQISLFIKRLINTMMFIDFVPAFLLLHLILND